MKDVIVTLLAQKPSELNSFLYTYFDEKIKVEDEAFMWSCIYSKPLESINLISTLIDNSEKYKIEALVSIKHLESIKISDENLEDFIRIMYYISSE